MSIARMRSALDNRRARVAASLATVLLLAGSLSTSESVAATAARVLRVCADPNNLPFSNDKLQGYENRIAQLIASDIDATVSYTWWAQRRGFIRNTLKARQCDLVMGLPSGFELALTTQPYYRSTYVFVYRRDRGIKVQSFDDPILRTVRVGVPIIGDDYANAPPAHALTTRGVVKNVVGFTVYGDYSKANPPARIIEAVDDGTIDVAIVWGPLAGYFAQRSHHPLEIVPVSPQIDLPFMPFVYDISLGVRRGEPGFKNQLEDVLRRRKGDIDRILDSYGVPRVGAQTVYAGR